MTPSVRKRVQTAVCRSRRATQAIDDWTRCSPCCGVRLRDDETIVPPKRRRVPNSSPRVRDRFILSEPLGESGPRRREREAVGERVAVATSIGAHELCVAPLAVARVRWGPPTPLPPLCRRAKADTIVYSTDGFPATKIRGPSPSSRVRFFQKIVASAPRRSYPCPRRATAPAHLTCRRVRSSCRISWQRPSPCASSARCHP